MARKCAPDWRKAKGRQGGNSRNLVEYILSQAELRGFRTPAHVGKDCRCGRHQCRGLLLQQPWLPPRVAWRQDCGACQGAGSQRLALVIRELMREDPRFQMEGGSRTDNISSVRGYESLRPSGVGKAVYESRTERADLFGMR